MRRITVYHAASLVRCGGLYTLSRTYGALLHVHVSSRSFPLPSKQLIIKFGFSHLNSKSQKYELVSNSQLIPSCMECKHSTPLSTCYYPLLITSVFIFRQSSKRPSLTTRYSAQVTIITKLVRETVDHVFRQ